MTKRKNLEGMIVTRIPTPLPGQKSRQVFPIFRKAELLLRFFIAGNTPLSKLAIQNLHQFCETILAREAQIIANPTLFKYSPDPKKIMIGDFSHKEPILNGVGLAV
jgi:circadian clock protein KaiB